MLGAIDKSGNKKGAISTFFVASINSREIDAL